MDSPKRRVYRSKIRKVTACLECHRRKQKCDRKQPCNICSNRGVPERCSYDNQPEKSTWTPVDDSTSESLDLHSPASGGAAIEGLSDLSRQFGYNDVLQKPTNALAELQHLPGLDVVNKQSVRSKMSSLPKLSSNTYRRYQQLLEELPSNRVIQQLIDAFFEEANWYFCTLDRLYFDESVRNWTSMYSRDRGFDIQKCTTSDALYFPALLFQILAMSMQFLSPKLREQYEISRLASPTYGDRSAIYSNAGETIMTLLGRRSGDNKTAVEADMMRAAWLKNSGSGLDAYYALGNAIRQAQDSALHLEPNEPDPHTIDPLELSELWRNKHRRRLWAVLFTWEGHMALQLGRPRMINAADCTVRTPLQTDIPHSPSRTLFRASTQPDEPPSVYAASLVKYQLARQIHRLMSLGAFTSTYPDYSTILAAHTQAEALGASLPPALRLISPDTRWDLQYPNIVRYRLLLPIIINSFLLALHRPHIRSQMISLEAALKAARAVLDLSQQLFAITPPHQYKTYTLIFYTIDAGLLLTVVLLHRHQIYSDGLPQHEWNEICNTMKQAIARLHILKESNTAAGTGETVLQKCYEKILQTGNKNMGFTPNTQISASLDYQDNSIDTVLSGSTAIDTDPTSSDQFDASLESFFDFDMLNEFMNNPAFTAHWLDQYNGLEYSDAMMGDIGNQIGGQTNLWGGHS